MKNVQCAMCNVQLPGRNHASLKKRALCCLCAFILLLTTSLPAFAKGDVTINVYNWGEYIDLDVLEMFEEENPGIKVNYTTFDSNESMYSKLMSGAASYDVVIPSEYMISKMIKEDMLLPLDFDNIPNYKYIGESYLGLEYDPDNTYSVPYTWGTVVIIYNSDYVDPEDVADESSMLLWNEKYAGKILMFDNPRDAFGIALPLLGYSMNSNNRKEWEEAKELLAKQKPLVQAYVMDAIFDKLESGEAWIGPYYAGDALIIQEENEAIRYYNPKEGTNMFLDAMCVPATATHKKEAEIFINFMCRPDIAALNAEAIGYATPNTGAMEILGPEVTGNELVYPSAEFLREHTEVFRDLTTEISVLQSQLWTSLKIASSESGNEEPDPINWIDVSCIIIIVLIAAGAVWHAIVSRRKRKLWEQ